MPPKESKELKNEICDIISQVKGYWSDFFINSELLMNPTVDFVTRFYTSVLTELNEKFSYLLEEETPTHEAVDTKDFDKEIHLFCAISAIFKKIRVETFCINDIYRPVPRRTRFFIRSILHFLVYVEANMQVCVDLTDNIIRKTDEKRKLTNDKLDLSEEISQHVANIVKEMDHQERLVAQKELVSLEYEKILKIKHTKEKLYADKQLQIKELKSECDNEEYQLKCLEKEEMNLKEQVVTEENYKDLKNMEEMLENELDKLEIEDTGLKDGLNAQKENLHSMESHARSLEKINLDILSEKVLTLQNLEDKEKKQSCDRIHLVEEMKHLQSVADKLKEDIKKLCDGLGSKEANYKILSEQVEKEMKNLKYEHEFQKGKTINIIKKAEEMQQTKKLLLDEIEHLKTEKETLKETFAAEYKKVLDTQTRVINKANAILGEIKTDISS